MELKELKLLVESLCEGLELDLSRTTQEKHKVSFNSGIRPSNYASPLFHVGSYKLIPDTFNVEWFCEISVDGTCIFRVCHHLTKGEDVEHIERLVTMQLLQHVFNYGIMSSKKMIDNTYAP